MSNLWNIFTAADEYGAAFSDRYGRFQRYMLSDRDVFSPVVSERLVQEAGLPQYPGGHSFALCLSHDVDHLMMPRSAYLKRVLAAKALIKGNFGGIKRAFSEDRMLHPAWDLSNTLAIEKKYDAHSSFYFLALDPNEKDYNYAIPDVTEQIRRVRAAGCEVGLHGGHGAHNTPEILQAHKQRLEAGSGEKVAGYRGHFLRFSTPLTWRLLAEAGFRHDSTFGFADCAGFRNGMCHPFLPWDREQQKFLPVVEVPLVLMDVTLVHHMNLGMDAAYEAGVMLIDRVAKLGGVATLLWHNNNMDGEMGKLYERFVRYAAGKGAWLASTQQVVSWWESSAWRKAGEEVIEAISRKQTAGS